MSEIKGINIMYSLLRRKDISTGEVFLLCLLNDIGINHHIPNNSFLAKTLGTSKQNISRQISKLIKKDYLYNKSKYSDKEVFEILSKGTTYKNGCKLCGYTKSTLDEHHYPIRAKDGGIKTIPICPNCHREFHELADHNRNLLFTDKATRIINER